jgi:hypothetical protein
VQRRRIDLSRQYYKRSAGSLKSGAAAESENGNRANSRGVVKRQLDASARDPIQNLDFRGGGSLPPQKLNLPRPDSITTHYWGHFRFLRIRRSDIKGRVVIANFGGMEE